MDETIKTPQDNYHIFVPIEDDDLMKSVSIDENGDYVVQGVMTSDAVDEEDDSINPEGMDCSYFLEKGWVKYEHGNKPEQFIGEPLEVKVGQFTHPTTQKSVKGIFVKARLFQQRDLAQQAVRTITDLNKSQTKRRMGWSIEGNVKERDRKTGKIIKSVLRNVVLTMNPINTTTWAELAKSFASNHELTVDMGDVAKALNLEATREIRAQRIEGVRNKYSQPEDPQQAWINSFRGYIKKLLKKKSFRHMFVKSITYANASAYAFATKEGYTAEEATGFASFIESKYEILKSLGEKIGGAPMDKNVQNTLAGLLDEDLEELQKSIALDDDTDTEEDFEVEEDELEKSFDDDEGDADDEGDEEEDEEDEEDEEAEKSFSTSFAKSFSAQEDNAQAIEVSSFLANMVDEIGYHMDGFEKSMRAQRKQSHAIVNALSSMGELMKSMHNELSEVKAHNAELQKSLTDLLSAPVGRRSVVNGREVQTLSKSMGAQGQAPTALTKGQIADELMKSFDSGEISGAEITRFEAGVPLSKLNLPASVKTRLGLA